jgi:hypothetical protein
MQTAGANELGYANTALILGLLEVLANKSVLSRSDLNTILTDAIGKLEPTCNATSTGGGIEFIKSLLPELYKTSS